MSEQRKPLWPWIVALLIGVPVLYVASFGPACWWFSEVSAANFSRIHVERASRAPHAYWPVGWIAIHGPASVRRAIGWYATRRFSVALLPANSSGEEIAILCPEFDRP
jgi:hypothetical protein